MAAPPCSVCSKHSPRSGHHRCGGPPVFSTWRDQQDHALIDESRTTSGDISNDLSAAESLLTHSSLNLYQLSLYCPAGRRTVGPDYFNSNSAISMRVVPMLRMPRVVPGSCQ